LERAPVKKMNHDGPESACGAEPSFNCPQCEMRCTRKSSLKLHLIEIHQVEPSQLEAFGLGILTSYAFKCFFLNIQFNKIYEQDAWFVQENSNVISDVERLSRVTMT